MKTKWTEEAVRDTASQYGTRAEFSKANNTAYKKALKLGIINDLFPIQPAPSADSNAEVVDLEVESHSARSSHIKWTDEAVRAEASKYNTRADFSKANHSAYRKAHKLGIMDELIVSRR